MLSVVGALVRVVIVTPLILVFYAFVTDPRTLVAATTASGGLDVSGLVAAIGSLPNIHLVLPITILVAIIGPHLPSGRQMND